MSEQKDATTQDQAKEQPTALLAEAEPETGATPPDRRRVLIRRKMQRVPKLDEQGEPVFDDNKQPVLVDEPMIRVPYEFEGAHKHIDLPADRNRFELPALVARAAVDTGHFEPDPQTRTRLK